MFHYVLVQRSLIHSYDAFDTVVLYCGWSDVQVIDDDLHSGHSYLP
jgi:hypothetical protein